MKYFVIADTHFWHQNIIRYCDRPFKNVDCMNSYITNKWNATVSKQDKVFMLGDFAWTNNLATLRQLWEKLNGYIILVKGNHDTCSNKVYLEAGFEEVSKYPILVEGYYLLSHEPLFLPSNSPYFNFYGHVHNDPRYRDTETSRCVSVERINYEPLKFFEKS